MTGSKSAALPRPLSEKDHTTLVAAVKAAGLVGATATITIPNIYQSNGVIHVISAGAMPS